MPQVTVSVELEPDLNNVLKPAAREALCQRLSGRADEILETLGIPGHASVEITTGGTKQASADRLMRVAVNNRWCHYSNELIQLVYSYMQGVPLGPAATAPEIFAWLGAGADRERPIEFLSLVCLEIIKKHAGLLLAIPQAAAYLETLPPLTEESDSMAKTWPPDPDWLLPILQAVLSLKLSIADKKTVAEVLRQGLGKNQAKDEIVEDLIVAVRPNAVEVQISPEYLRQITTATDDGEHNQFALMRDGLFYELGLRYPNFGFVAVESLKPCSFALKINHLTTTPRVGLAPKKLLVNDTVERLKLLNIEAEAAINPANANKCAIINSAAKDLVESAAYQLTTWDQLGFLVLSFATELRMNSASLIDRQVVQDQLGQLEMAFPRLVEAAHRAVSVHQLTRVLRCLVAEEISIRNLRAILQSIIDYDYVVTDPLKYIVFDERLPLPRQPDEVRLRDPINMAAFVRSALKRYISHKFTRGESSLVVYLLDAEIEKLLSRDHAVGSVGLNDHERDAILQSVRAEVGNTPRSAATSAILTTIDVRAALRELIAAEFPRVPVLAYQELSPDLNIQPIARISL
ncbi:MAG: FHIPEP family type III secretion protein [Deltaproteobacteria bacterium]|nr:FHIPEP family type III secretion protein [Deltaproteobacteria bacterium]